MPETRLLALLPFVLIACAGPQPGGADSSPADVLAQDAVMDTVAPMDTVVAMDTAVPMDTAVAMDTVVSMDTATRDTATGTDVVARDTIAAMDTGGGRDVLATDVRTDVVRACSAACTTSPSCSLSCPPPLTGSWCCVAGVCQDLAVCPVPADAATCTGANECDGMHPCATGMRCCAPLPGLPGCGHCSGGICPG
jgi:hypothetical protein